MSDEHLQKPGAVNSLDAIVNAGVGGRQALVLSAFMDERRKWEEKKGLLQEELNTKLEAYKKASASVDDEPSWKKFLYHKLLRRLTPAAVNLEKTMQEIDDVAGKIIEHDAAEPNAVRYELAALGNNLFKPR